MIVRSNGVVTYVGKDIANQFWKFGLLGRDFHYRRFATQAHGRSLWATTSATGEPAAPPFGHATRIYNVIDSRQMYLQALLSQALRDARAPDGSRELDSLLLRDGRAVARHGARAGLRHRGGRRAREKPFVEVSGRKGLGVKIDDLLDLLTDKAAAEVAKRNPEFSRRASAGGSASQIAVAAIRYFMLKFSRGKLIVFDIEEALSFEGETGPYLQYAVVRANNILQKLQEREGVTRGRRARRARRDCRPTSSTEAPTSAHDLWARGASRRPGSTISSSRWCGRWSFRSWRSTRSGWRRLFNAFYHRYPILNEERRRSKAVAGGRRGVLPGAADAGARSDGDRQFRPGCNAWRSP